MEKLRKQKGFTLLEIIIVIIIVGVLASLALPRFFSTVEFSRATEALSSLQTVRSAIERCYLQTSDYTKCTAMTDLDIGDPASAVGSHFTYVLTSQGSTVGFTIQANRGTLDGGTTTDWIRLRQDLVGVTKSGTGNFSGIK